MWNHWNITDFNLILYSSPPLIGTALLPNNSLHIKEVSFGEREDLKHPQYLLLNNSVLISEVSFDEGPLHKYIYINMYFWNSLVKASTDISLCEQPTGRASMAFPNAQFINFFSFRKPSKTQLQDGQ